MPNLLVFQECEVTESNADIEILGHRIRRRRHLKSHDQRLTSSLNDISKVRHKRLASHGENGVLSNIDLRRGHQLNKLKNTEHVSVVPEILPGRVHKGIQVGGKSDVTSSHNRSYSSKYYPDRPKSQQTYDSYHDEDDNLQAKLKNKKVPGSKVNCGNISRRANRVHEISGNRSLRDVDGETSAGNGLSQSKKEEIPKYEPLMNGLTLVHRSLSPRSYSSLRRLSVLQGIHPLPFPLAPLSKLLDTMEEPWTKTRLQNLGYPFKIQTPILDINNSEEKQRHITNAERKNGVNVTGEFGHDLLNFQMSNGIFANRRKLAVPADEVSATKPPYLHRPGFHADHVSHPPDSAVGKIIQRRHRYFQENRLQVLGSKSHGSNSVHHQTSENGIERLESSSGKGTDGVPSIATRVLGNDWKVEAGDTSTQLQNNDVNSTNVQKVNTCENSALQDFKEKENGFGIQTDSRSTVIEIKRKDSWNKNESADPSHDSRPNPSTLPSLCQTTEVPCVDHSTKGQTCPSSTPTRIKDKSSRSISLQTSPELLNNKNVQIGNKHTARQVDSNDKKQDCFNIFISENGGFPKSKTDCADEKTKENSYSNSHSHDKIQEMTDALENINSSSGIINANDSMHHTSISLNNPLGNIQPCTSATAVKNAKTSGDQNVVAVHKSNEQIVKNSAQNLHQENGSNSLLSHDFKEPTKMTVEELPNETNVSGLMVLPGIKVKDTGVPELKTVTIVPEKDSYLDHTLVSSKPREAHVLSSPKTQSSKPIPRKPEIRSDVVDDKKIELPRPVSTNASDQESKDKKQDWIIFRDYISTHLGGYGSKYNVWTNKSPTSVHHHLGEEKPLSDGDQVFKSHDGWRLKDKLNMPQICVSSGDKDDNNNINMKTNRSDSRVKYRNGLAASSDTKVASRLTWKLTELATRRSHRYQQAREALGTKDVIVKLPSRPVSRETSPRHVSFSNVDLRPSSRGAQLRSLGQKNSVPFRIRSADLQGSSENPKHIDIVQKCQTFKRAVESSQKGASGREFTGNGGDQSLKVPITKKQTADFIYSVDKLQEKHAGTSDGAPQRPDPQTQELLDYFWSYQGMGRQILRADSGNISPFRGTQFWKSQAVETLATKEESTPLENAKHSGTIANTGNFTINTENTESNNCAERDKKELSYNGLLKRDGEREKKKVRLVVKMPLTEIGAEDCTKS